MSGCVLTCLDSSQICHEFLFIRVMIATTMFFGLFLVDRSLHKKFQSTSGLEGGIRRIQGRSDDWFFVKIEKTIFRYPFYCPSGAGRESRAKVWHIPFLGAAFPNISCGFFCSGFPPILTLFHLPRNKSIPLFTTHSLFWAKFESIPTVQSSAGVWV